MKKEDHSYQALLVVMAIVGIGMFASLAYKTTAFETRGNKYKYSVLSSEYNGYTNKYTIDGGCALFEDFNENNVSICGDFVIKSNTLPN